MTGPKIGVFGAGAIGGHLGGLLIHGGADVVLVGRDSRRAEVAQRGMRLTDYRQADVILPPGRISFHTDPNALAHCDLVLVTVKSGQTDAAAEALAPVLKDDALVISLQNGIGNAGVLAAGLPDLEVLAGMVPYNVVIVAAGVYHQGTEGQIRVAESHRLTPFLEAFRNAGRPLKPVRDMEGVLWAKLLMNLNNAVNALANRPLKDELMQRGYRLCLALAIEEALALLDEEGRVRLARLTPLPPHWLPAVLRLPDGIFRRLAKRMLEMDGKARSSMSDDLAEGRLPEVAWINGEIEALARRLGRAAPVNARLAELVLAAHGAPRRLSWPAGQLLAELEAAVSATAGR
ncbi:2-dehydropantoate 2-reductase [Mesobacterium pallidum]|uniref:2-dehydropantoate 2-reductase n=1 Tax=Mesobacterium pallidum TaxID=2872037 RepID=UPI001EE1C638